MRLTRIAAMAIAALVSIAAAPHPDWTRTVAVGPNGSHVLGNPHAKVKLTEFISYTCPHCAHFHKESDAALKLGYVLQGRVSIEVRHFVRDPVDLAAALLTNCGDPRQFFRNHNAILQSQDRWIGVMGKASDGQKARWKSGALGARMKAIANDFGFQRMMEQRGYTRQAINQCLGDEAKARQLTAQTQAAVAAGVEGTPSFMLNGALLDDTYDWRSLEMQMKARL